MSIVHRSRGGSSPPRRRLRSEPAIVAGLARATLGAGDGVPWEALVGDYDRIRERIARVVPGFEDFNRRVRDARRLRAAERRAQPRLRDAERPRARFRESRCRASRARARASS